MLTEVQAEGALRRFTRARWEVLQELAAETPNDGIAPALLAGIGYRESHLTNITGDGGHGRGVFQIDDRSHQAFLRSVPGCHSGHWAATHKPSEGGALTAGFVPGFVRGGAYAVALLHGNWHFAAQNGVPAKDRKRFAVAAFNCGAGNALRSFRAGGISNIDARTAGGDYSRDVIANQIAFSHAAAKLGWA